MSIDYGFVYFLSNSSMPGMYKIGFTTKHPRLRMVELASASGCPTPFTLLAYFGTPDPQRIESTLHRYFFNCRVNGRREFFSIGVTDIARALDHFSARFDDAVYRSKLDALVALYASEPAPPPPKMVREKTEEEIEEGRRFCRGQLANLKAILSPQN